MAWAGAFALVVAYAWWATGLEPFSARATGAVLGAGIVAVALAAGHGVTTREHDAEVAVGGVLIWLLLLAALAVWELAAYLQAPRAQHPTLSHLANGILEVRPVRAIAFVAWLAGAARLAR